jgi:hypothetical protein
LRCRAPSSAAPPPLAAGRSPPAPASPPASLPIGRHAQLTFGVRPNPVRKASLRHAQCLGHHRCRMSKLDLPDRLLLELQGISPSAASFVHLFAPVPAFSRELDFELRNSRATSALLYTVSSACHCRARRWRKAPVNGRRCVAERITSFRVPRVLALYNH